MKIIIISNTSWNLFNFRLPLMSRLRDKGFEVVAVAPRDEYSLRLSEAGFRYIEMAMDNKGTNPVTDLGLIWRLFKLFKSERPDVVLSYTPKANIYASIAAGMASVLIIPNVSGLGNVFIRQGLVTRVVKLLYRFAFRFPPLIFFQNHDDLNLFIALGLVKRHKTKRIPGSGINTIAFAPLVEKKNRSSSIVFLLVARILWDKGIGEFVEAARILKRKYQTVEFQLLGFLDVENPQAVSRTQVEQWVAEGVINYLGVSDSVVDIMRNADCVVLPSYREGLPRTLIEAGSLAKPIVTTDVPGCRDVVDDGINGFLCKPKDAEDLAAKMLKMISLSPSERNKMGKAGRVKIENEFDEKIVIQAYLKELSAIAASDSK